MIPENIVLHNEENYNLTLDLDLVEYLKRYTSLVKEYLGQCENKVLSKDLRYQSAIIFKGVNTLTHIYNYILMYTRNIDIAYYHSHKSLYYYIEFISQIGNNTHSFLQLNSTDAVLFILKKTLFELDHSKCNVAENNYTKLNIIKLFTEIHNAYLINEDDIKYLKYNNIEEPYNIIALLVNANNKISKSLINIYIRYNNDSEYMEALNTCNIFINSITHINKDRSNQLFISFTKKLLSKNCNLNNINSNLKSVILYEKINLLQSKFFTWLFN